MFSAGTGARVTPASTAICRPPSRDQSRYRRREKRHHFPRRNARRLRHRLSPPQNPAAGYEHVRRLSIPAALPATSPDPGTREGRPIANGAYSAASASTIASPRYTFHPAAIAGAFAPLEPSITVAPESRKSSQARASPLDPPPKPNSLARSRSSPASPPPSPTPAFPPAAPASPPVRFRTRASAPSLPRQLRYSSHLSIPIVQLVVVSVPIDHRQRMQRMPALHLRTHHHIRHSHDPPQSSPPSGSRRACDRAARPARSR